MSQNNPLNLPVEQIDLPSRGLIYPETSPLSKGYVEMKMPTAKEEDILTNVNYLRQGIAIDKFLASICTTKFDIDELIDGDKEAIQIAARVLGYGKDYMFKSGDRVITADLTTMPEKVLTEDKVVKGTNEFSFVLPHGQAEIKWKLFTGKDRKQMDKEEEGMKKIIPDYSANITLKFYHCITEVNGDRTTDGIRKFVNTITLRDSKAFREHMDEVSPGYTWKATCKTDKGEILEGLAVPYTVDFFWP